MDAITLLRDDHKKVKSLFRQFEQTGERAVKTQADLVNQMITELSIHASIEEQLFYPFVRKVVPEAAADVLEGLEEHHIVKWTLSELEDMDPTNERFVAKVTVLMESVRHHIEDEEGEMFPRVREGAGRKQLAQLGEDMLELKKASPKRPHPRSPDTPPGNRLVGPAAVTIDRLRQVGSDAVNRLR
jgi:hemerythrin superfamily protein